jgi:uncharacterized protein YdeI (YjbR/CyaY-like superfamily)
MKPVYFKTQEKFREWLEKNHSKKKELLVGFYKVGSGKPGITWSEAVDEALCYGWIDGIRKSIDSESYTIRFTPRKATSIWSAINIKKIEELSKQGLMKPAGLKEAEAAKADGRWNRAYDSPGTMTIPGDFLHRLSKNKKASAFFETLNRANKYAITWRLQTAKKPETRENRIKMILEMLAREEKFHD